MKDRRQDNQKRNRKRFIIIPAAVLVAAGVLLYSCRMRGVQMPSQERALERVKAFAQAVNYEYEHAEKIYPYLTQALRKEMTEAEFVEAFATERTYPYLSPLFINYDSMEIAKDQKSGTAIFSQAARLPGMIYEVPFVYENGDYYMDIFHEYADGSYLDKFKVLEEQSDWVDVIFSKEYSMDVKSQYETETEA